MAPAPPRSKLSHGSILIVAVAAIAVVAIVITIVAVNTRTKAQACGFYCGPHTGTRLAGARQFVDTKWGFTIDYDSELTPNPAQLSPTADSVEFDVAGQSGNVVGAVVVKAMQATDPQQAIQAELGAINSNTLQDITPVEAVPGAEVGLIPAAGEGYSATLVPSDGGSGEPIGMLILAATHGNVTLVAVVQGISSQQGDAPFYIIADQPLDYVLTNLHFQGGG